MNNLKAVLCRGGLVSTQKRCLDRAPMLFAVLLVCFGTSCGDSINAKKSDPNESEEISSICESRIERGTRCEEFVPELAECNLEKRCEKKRFNAEAFERVSECEIALACGASDDPCTDSKALGLTPSASAKAYLDACVPQANTCGFPVDELCNRALIFNDAILIEFKACLTVPCKKMLGCVREAVDICD